MAPWSCGWLPRQPVTETDVTEQPAVWSTPGTNVLYQPRPVSKWQLVLLVHPTESCPLNKQVRYSCRLLFMELLRKL